MLSISHYLFSPLHLFSLSLCFPTYLPAYQPYYLPTYMPPSFQLPFFIIIHQSVSSHQSLPHILFNHCTFSLISVATFSIRLSFSYPCHFSHNTTHAFISNYITNNKYIAVFQQTHTRMYTLAQTHMCTHTQTTFFLLYIFSLLY